MFARALLLLLVTAGALCAAGGRPIVIAHRGSSAAAPENTLAAFRLAIEQGADSCEFDVYRSSDGQLFLFHDKDLKRTTDAEAVLGTGAGKRNAAELTWDELRKLDAGSWKGKAFAGERIPTLAEALRLMKGRITPIIEIKPADIGREVATVVRELGMEKEVFVQSFAPQAVRDFLAVLPEVPAGLLIGEEDELDPVSRAREHIRQARAVGASAVVCNHELVSSAFVHDLHRKAMAIWVYTVDEVPRMSELAAMGIDGLITNVPEVALRARGGPKVGGLGGEEAESSDWRIAAGEIPARSLAKLYAGWVGVPMVSEVADVKRLEAPVVVTARIDHADEEVVKELLASVGLGIAVRELATGRRVVVLEDARAPAVARALRPTPVVAVGGGKSSGSQTAVVVRGPDSDAATLGPWSLAPVSAALAAQLGLPARAGALVSAGDEPSRFSGRSSSRTEAGLRVFDVITNLDTVPVRSPRHLLELIDRVEAEETAELRLLRKGRVLILMLRR